MKLAAATVLGLLVLGGAWRGCDDSGARPGKRSAWWGWWRPAGPGAGGGLAPVAADAMCITLGEVQPVAGGGVRVKDAKVRGVGVRTAGRSAELRFVYRGASAEVARLGSGKVFHQLGLKLEAQDGCNLLYVMWRLETGVEALVKKNPGQSVHSECGNRGYRKLKPEVSRPAPALEPGAAHRLSAELVGTRLIARVDGAPVLEAEVGELGFSGPAGFRTDNVQADLELHARPSDSAVPCTRGGD
ncbi:MAG TPA: hypothetical protein VFU21_13615 [Kofleriaceae bacterium]|nr:hypothetical protein [Kofleriaceae bacterium]